MMNVKATIAVWLACIAMLTVAFPYQYSPTTGGNNTEVASTGSNGTLPESPIANLSKPQPQTFDTGKYVELEFHEFGERLNRITVQVVLAGLKGQIHPFVESQPFATMEARRAWARRDGTTVYLEKTRGPYAHDFTWELAEDSVNGLDDFFVKHADGEYYGTTFDIYFIKIDETRELVGSGAIDFQPPASASS